MFFLFLGHGAAAPTTPVQITDKRTQLTQPERDLMDVLCDFSDSITSNVTTAADSNFSNKFNQSYELDPMMEIDMLQGRRAEENTTAPDFDFDLINWVDQNRTSERLLSNPIPEKVEENNNCSLTESEPKSCLKFQILDFGDLDLFWVDQ